MGFVLNVFPLLLLLGVFAAIVYGWCQLYGLKPKFGRGQVDARGQLVGPGTRAAIAWDTLVRIEIVTTDQGPFQEDVFWFFVDADGSACSLPGAEVDGSVLERVSALPGVHYEAVIQAMGSCEDAQFLVWSRTESGASAPRALASSLTGSSNAAADDRLDPMHRTV
jgi:hypothetical protein